MHQRSPLNHQLKHLLYLRTVLGCSISLEYIQRQRMPFIFRAVKVQKNNIRSTWFKLFKWLYSLFYFVFLDKLYKWLYSLFYFVFRDKFRSFFRSSLEGLSFHSTLLVLYPITLPEKSLCRFINPKVRSSTKTSLKDVVFTLELNCSTVFSKAPREFSQWPADPDVTLRTTGI